MNQKSIPSRRSFMQTAIGAGAAVLGGNSFAQAVAFTPNTR